MTIPTKKLVWALAATAVAIVAAAIWWTVDDEPEPVVADIDVEVPMDVPADWADRGGDDDLRVDVADPLVWSDDTDTALIEGPTVDGLDIEWSSGHNDGWQLLSGSGHDETIDLDARLWTSEGFPAAIIDFDARIHGEALADELAATTRIEADDLHLLTASLDTIGADESIDGTRLTAGRFARGESIFSIHSPDGAVGRIAAGDDVDHVDIDWTIWPGLDGYGDCLDDDLTRTVSMRLVVGFGSHPTVGPLSIPVGHRAMATPIFTDAPDDGYGSEGASRDAADFARRLRALARGHSDRDDPRYGNGGLLAADLGAIFAIPADWWEEAAIVKLRESLASSDIDVVPDGSVDTDDEPSPPTRIGDGDDCDLLASSSADSLAPSVVHRRADDDRPFELPLTTPVPPVVEAGEFGPDRDALLKRLFSTDGDDNLLSPGAHRGAFIPVIATRNPLEEIASDQLLSPDRGGHWTLDESLTRSLSRVELEADHNPRLTTGFGALRDHRLDHRRALPYFSPDGRLALPDESARHFYVFGADADLDIDAEVTDTAAYWHHDPDNPPVWNGELRGVTIEFRETE